MAELRTPAGKVVPGHLEVGPGEGAPAVIVIQEWWGVTDQIRGIARRLAAAGFQVFAPDLYRGKTTRDAVEAERLMDALDKRAALRDLHEAVEALGPRSGGRVGVLGFCMGGMLALATAAHEPEVKACVPYYGIPQPELADVRRIRASVLGHFGNRDGWVTPARVDALEKALVSAKVKATLHRYDADHAFANEQRPEVYAPEPTRLAWERTLAFLHGELDRPAAGA